MLDFHAGKYALFVWPAYAVTVVVFVVLTVVTLARAGHWRREVGRREVGRREADRHEIERRDRPAPGDDARP